MLGNFTQAACRVPETIVLLTMAMLVQLWVRHVSDESSSKTHEICLRTHASSLAQEATQARHARQHAVFNGCTKAAGCSAELFVHVSMATLLETQLQHAHMSGVFSKLLAPSFILLWVSGAAGAAACHAATGAVQKADFAVSAESRHHTLPAASDAVACQ